MNGDDGGQVNKAFSIDDDDSEVFHEIPLSTDTDASTGDKSKQVSRRFSEQHCLF